jgi:hypothetical protein
MLHQGHDSAPGLDIMLLKQQFLGVSAQPANQARQHPSCTVAAIPCCSFFPRNWLSGLQTTLLRTWMCHPDLTRPNPGVQQHSIEFCRPALCLTRRINIHTFQTVEFESDLYRGVMRARCYPFDMDHHRFRGKHVKVCACTWYMYCISIVYVSDIPYYSLYIHVLTWSCYCRIVWQLSLPIHSTLESVTTIMTLLTHYSIQTVCGLCVPSCSSTVCYVPLVLGWAAKIVATRTFH